MSTLFTSKGKISQACKWGYALVKSDIVKRVFDAKPIWAQLKITERCNLNCGYCFEHNNKGVHVPMETINSRIKHCAELGVKHVELIGGEPLLHPGLFDMLKTIRGLKMNTGLTTNGFLMNKEIADKLIKSGITRLQLSIDCIAPNVVTRKALNLLKPQLELISDMDILVHVNSVITKETLPQAVELAERLFEMGIPVAFSPAHNKGRLIVEKPTDSMIDFFDWLSVKKHEGCPVNMAQFLIDYYRNKMDGKTIPWTCEGGCKAFYVDTDGNFMICSHKQSGLKLTDVNKSTLRNNHRLEKGCENNCGVSCMIVNSFPFCRLHDVIRADLIRGSEPEKRLKKDAHCEEIL